MDTYKNTFVTQTRARASLRHVICMYIYIEIIALVSSTKQSTESSLTNEICQANLRIVLYVFEKQDEVVVKQIQLYQSRNGKRACKWGKRTQRNMDLPRGTFCVIRCLSQKCRQIGWLVGWQVGNKVSEFSRGEGLKNYVRRIFLAQPRTCSTLFFFRSLVSDFYEREKPTARQHVTVRQLTLF